METKMSIALFFYRQISYIRFYEDSIIDTISFKSFFRFL